MRRQSAKWWDLDAVTPEALDDIRQYVESGSSGDVALIALKCDQIADEVADRFQDVAGEYFTGLNDHRPVLLLRSHAWTMERAENHERMMGLIHVLEQAVQMACTADSEQGQQLAEQSADLLSAYPDLQERFLDLQQTSNPNL
ncbi:hypothetical protein [Sulfobacillus sp. hq2]|uniref:hypothetical protein n=1 Tax=Sulfobacillus TaxID=28033 RepID=UPI000CD16728|nr:hypothetical protein [Sulfobacillus sp. hq2]POB09823.1 hypothetical protein CO251_13050 [Sulfobacillus sp. hq2]